MADEAAAASVPQLVYEHKPGPTKVSFYIPPELAGVRFTLTHEKRAAVKRSRAQAGQDGEVQAEPPKKKRTETPEQKAKAKARREKSKIEKEKKKAETKDAERASVFATGLDALTAPAVLTTAATPQEQAKTSFVISQAVAAELAASKASTTARTTSKKPIPGLIEDRDDEDDDGSGSSDSESD
jgi:hypothetical protein